MTLVTVFDLNIRQYDAMKVFVNNIMNETIFCKILFGWIKNPNILLKLLKKIYGLKQSPILWHNYFITTVIELEFDQISKIECVYLDA